mgnify:CR=1 FL=1
MDRYSKTVLTIIAIALAAIAIKLWEPRPAQAAMFEASRPTVGDLMDLRNIKDQQKMQEAAIQITRRVPLVRVHGNVEVTGEVMVAR